MGFLFLFNYSLLIATPHRWSGAEHKEKEVGRGQDGKVYVRIDPKYYRPTEVDLLLGKQTHSFSMHTHTLLRMHMTNKYAPTHKNAPPHI